MPSQRPASNGRLVLSWALLFCACALLYGWSMRDVARYESAAGSTTPTFWPAGMPVPLASNGYTVLAVIHPQCPCSESTLLQLDRLVAAHRGNTTAYVLLEGIADADYGRRYEQRFPELNVVADSGALAEKLGARNAGHVFVFGSLGELLFSGGITNAGAAAGRNIGQETVERILASRPALCFQTKVYGCSLKKLDVHARAGG